MIQLRRHPEAVLVSIQDLLVQFDSQSRPGRQLQVAILDGLKRLLQQSVPQSGPPAAKGAFLNQKIWPPDFGNWTPVGLSWSRLNPMSTLGLRADRSRLVG